MKSLVNLLPSSYRRQLMLRRRALQWGTVICLVSLCGGAWHWYELRENTAMSQQLEGLMREHAPIQALLQQLVEMRQQLEELRQQEAVARELEYQRNALALLGVVSRAARQAEGRLRVTKLELTNLQSPPSAGGSAAAGRLSLRGVSLDNPAVYELLDSLQGSGLFSLVELLAVKERHDNESSFREYEIRCDF